MDKSEIKQSINVCKNFKINNMFNEKCNRSNEKWRNISKWNNLHCINKQNIEYFWKTLKIRTIHSKRPKCIHILQKIIDI